MMAEYATLAALPDCVNRLDALDLWLTRYGHRGPLESDPMQPRFSELRDTLRANLEHGSEPTPSPRTQPSSLRSALTRPLFWLDEVREDFRDRNMRWWGRLRQRLLKEAGLAVLAGHLDTPDDVFQFRAEDLAADPTTWRDRARTRRARVNAVSHVELPSTASRDVIESALLNSRTAVINASADLFLGSGLDRSCRAVAGTAVVARCLTELLRGRALPESPILVVDTLEPSWAVVFPRFTAVVSELGGELSHASILLREAGIPSVVNASGAYRSIGNGDQIEVDPGSGEVRIIAHVADITRNN